MITKNHDGFTLISPVPSLFSFVFFSFFPSFPKLSARKKILKNSSSGPSQFPATMKRSVISEEREKNDQARSDGGG